jgi:hypothetical protein
MRTALFCVAVAAVLLGAVAVQAEKYVEPHPDYSRGLLDCSNAIPIACGAVVTGTNAGFPANVMYYSCIGWNESGPEVVYSFEVVYPNCVKLTATLSGMSADLDVFLLNGCEETSCLKYGDSTFTSDCLAPGIYYIVVDGYNGAVSGYTLTVSCVPCACPGTPCPPAQHTIPFHEDFERSDCFPPEGWTIHNLGDNPAGETWEWADYNYCSGSGTARCYWGATSEYQDEWFITPVLYTTGYSALELTFQHKSSTWSYCTHPKKVLVSTTDTNVESFFDVFTYLCTDPIPNCQTVTVTIGEPFLPADHLYIAWRYQGVWAESYNLDNIVITGQVTPVEPVSWTTIKALYR